MKDNSKNEEVDGRLSPEPVCPVEGENPGLWRKKGGDDFGIGEATDASIVEEASYSGSIGLGQDAACKGETDPGHTDSSLFENGQNEEGDEVAVRSEFSYTFSEHSFERSEVLGFGHLVTFFGLKQPQGSPKWPNRQPVKSNRENCLSRTVSIH